MAVAVLDSLRSLARSHVRSGGRRHLVGLLPEDPKGVLPEGSHIVGDPHGRPPVPLLGNVTSTYYSPALERAIALALLNDGHARYGERVSVSLPGGVMRAEVVKPPFYDAEGARLHA